MLSLASHWPRFGPGTDISGHDANNFYARGRDGRYHEIAEQVGFGRRQVSRAIATADVNRDGRLDVLVANQWQRSHLYLNRCPKSCGSSLQLRLMLRVAGGRASPAIGAHVTVRTRDGRRMVRQVDGGNGHSGKRSAALFFGLGSEREPVAVTVRWRDANGVVRSRALRLRPGIHTIVLSGTGGRT